MNSSKAITLLLFMALLFLMASCNTADPLDVVMGDSCEYTGERVYFEGLYRSEQKTCGNYYCWGFIRFFEDCTYESITSTQENFNSVAKDVFLSRSESVTVGQYSIEGATIKLVSDTNEQIGQIEGNKLILDWYAYKTKKSGQTVYEYAHVNAIRDEINTFQGPTMPEPTKTGD